MPRITEENTVCNSCGERISAEVQRTHDNLIFCVSCFNERFFTCAHCNGTFLHRFRFTSNGGDFVCGDCADTESEADNSVSCAICGESIPANEASEYSGDSYCSQCFDDEFTECPSCGVLVRREDVSEDETCDRCRNCSIRSYSFKPAPKFYKTEKDNKGRNTNLFFGIELEVENGGRCATNNETANNIIKEKIFYCKTDGSLDNGFEVVSMPFTFNYFIEKKKKFFTMLEYLKAKGFKSFNTSTCGIHVHMPKSMFSTLQIYKLLKFFYSVENRRFIEFIAQRRANSFARIGETESKEMVKVAKEKYTAERYSAVNLQNNKTIEIRSFKGTLKVESFAKNIEFCDALYWFTKDSKINDMNRNCFFKFVEQNNKKYINLFSHLQKGEQREGIKCA